MRRRELEVEDPAFFADVAARAMFGTLALILPDGFPRAVAVNFAAVGRAIYFHGALAGEKFEVIRAGGPAGFTMVVPLATLPSRWLAPRHACPATQLFRSVEARGRCVVVEDPLEKARGLTALMDKHQPEGGFDPIDAADPRYRHEIDRVGVFRLDVERWTGKLKVGRDYRADLRRDLIGKLRRRGGPADPATILEIEDTLADGD